MSDSPPSGFGAWLNRALQQQVSLADTKLSGLIGFSATLSGLLLFAPPSFHRSAVPNPFASFGAFLTSIAPVTYILTLLFFLITIVNAAIGFYSRSEREHEVNVVYWRWIGRQPLDKYQKEVNALTESTVEEAYAQDNHRLSTRLGWKNRFIQYAAFAFLLGLFCGVASTAAALLVK